MNLIFLFIAELELNQSKTYFKRYKPSVTARFRYFEKPLKSLICFTEIFKNKGQKALLNIVLKKENLI